MPTPTDWYRPATAAALAERLNTREGRDALLRMANQIAKTAVEALPETLKAELRTPGGLAALQAAWPDIVADFLMWGVRASREQSSAKSDERAAGSDDAREE